MPTEPRYDLAMLIGSDLSANEVQRLLALAAGYLGSLPGEELIPMEVDRGLRDLLAQQGVEDAALFRPLRVALQGNVTNVSLYETMRQLGREGTLARVQTALGALNARA